MEFIELDRIGRKITRGTNMTSPSAATERNILGKAEDILGARGEKLTPLRRRVLSIVAQAPEPLSAYGILEKMADHAKQPAPPTVYRTLDFLIANGLVHKIHSRNTFVACSKAHSPHDAELFLCRLCGSAHEVAHDHRLNDVQEDARDLGFEPERVVVEIEGVCSNCKDGHS